MLGTGCQGYWQPVACPCGHRYLYSLLTVVATHFHWLFWLPTFNSCCQGYPTHCHGYLISCHGYPPLAWSTSLRAWSSSSVLHSVYSTKTSSNFRAVLTTRRNYNVNRNLVRNIILYTINAQSISVCTDIHCTNLHNIYITCHFEHMMQ